MKRLSSVFVVCLALCILCTLFGACQNAPAGNSSSTSSPSQTTSSGSTPSSSGEKETYHVAMIAPLSGSSMQYGESLRTAMEIKLEEVNNGDYSFLLACDFYDDKNEATEAVTLANKIVAQSDILACFGPFSSTCAIAAGPVFQKAGMLLCSPTSSHEDFTSIGDYMVRGSTLQETMQYFTAKFVYEDLGLQTAAFLAGNDDVGNAIIQYFSQTFEELGGEVLSADTYVKGSTKDFTPMLSKLTANQPELLYLYGTYGDVASIITQARQLDIRSQLLSNGGAMTQELLQIAGEDAEGMIFYTTYDPNYPNPALEAFKEAFEAKTGRSIDSHATSTYDLISIFVEKLSEVGPDREKLKTAMRNFDSYEGLFGTYSMENGDITGGHFPVIVENGQFVSYSV